MQDGTNHTSPRVESVGVVMCEEEEKRGEKMGVGIEFIVADKGARRDWEQPQATQSQISTGLRVIQGHSNAPYSSTVMPGVMP